MSPDEMSDDRIREAIDYYRKFEQEDLADGNHGSARRCATKAAQFEELLAEREAQRAADVEEIFAAVVIEEPQPVAV